MSKYPPCQSADAIYSHSPSGNPFLDALPDLHPPNKFAAQIASTPPLPHDLGGLSPEARRSMLTDLQALFVPMDYMYAIYDTLYRAIKTTYTTQSVLDGIRQINALFSGSGIQSYATQADSGSILGAPGIGKTSTIRRCLSVMPQVINHMEYQGQPFYTKQILYLHVECPSDCSVKTLAYNIITALDRALGTQYLDSVSALKAASASAIATQVKILCMTYHIGVLVVDEIQNAVLTARKNRQTKPLIKFLVELTNDTSTAIYFVGTPLAEELFVAQEHLKRRTRGIRLLPLRPDGLYRKFLKKIWPYQYTATQAPMTDKLANKLYDYSGGIPAYIVKIWQETQAWAILMGRNCIDDKIMQQAINTLAIEVPKTYSGGTHISDFELGQEAKRETRNPEEEKRQYAHGRGRKVTEREPGDLLVAFKAGIDLLQHLEACGLLEEVCDE